MLKNILRKVRELLDKAREFFDESGDVLYLSVPVWKPWRDF